MSWRAAARPASRKETLMERADRNRVGIIGAGRIGQAMTGVALRAGREVVIANSRGPESLTSLVATLGDGVTAGAVGDAAAGGVRWTDQVVIDAMNDFDPSDLNGRASSELVADLVAPARVVKAGNTWAAAILASDPHEAGGQRVIFLSGDDLDAKADVVALFEGAGFSTIDLGGLSGGGKLQQVRGPLAGVNLVRLP